jgi:SAM-dependent methyltransferase
MSHIATMTSLQSVFVTTPPSRPSETPPANARRFDGFADLYDTHRPSPPAELGLLLARYCGVKTPEVVDLGSGSGLSTRWAAAWAAHVVGVEPGDDMRTVATRCPLPNVEYVAGTSDNTGLPPDSADIVLIVQAMHWMVPDVTHAEVGRLLRPGGVVAVIDADWPPVTGLVAAETAWRTVSRRIRELENRVHSSTDLAGLQQPISDAPSIGEDHHDPHKDRLMPAGASSWSKSGHLERMTASGRYAYTRELCWHSDRVGGAEDFVAVLRSQGSYQGLIALGLTDDDIGVTTFERGVHAAYATVTTPPPLGYTWRIRLGITA